MAKYHNKKRNKASPKYVIEDDPIIFEQIVVHLDESEESFWNMEEVDKGDTVVNRLLDRSFLSVIKSYQFRKDKGIKKKNIYVYDGYQEAQRLLNRSVKDAIKEYFERTSRPQDSK